MRVMLRVLLAITVLLSVSNHAAAKKQPNVIVIFTDDHGFGDIGRYNKNINTPNIDRLADESVRFTQFYVHSACAPTRASLLTGRSNHSINSLSLIYCLIYLI